MKKNLLFILLFAVATLFAQEATIVMHTSKAQGLPVKLEMRLLNPGDVIVDWGNGNRINYKVSNTSTTLQGVLSGKLIKIYGKDISFLSCANLDIIELDVSKANELQQLYCDKNDLIKLDVSNNTKLVRLGAHTNKLSWLDLSQNPKLTGLYLQNNNFDSRALNQMFNTVSKLKNMPSNINFRIMNNPGTEGSNTQIAIDKNWNLDSQGDNSGGKPIIMTTSKKEGDEILLELRLLAAGNIEIDFGNGPKQIEISTETTRVRGKLESGNTIKIYGDNINFLKCERNSLTLLDVRNAKNLQQLYCGYNELKAVDVSQNTKLLRLGCNNNKIRSLDLRDNEKISGMYFQNNNMDACTLNQLYHQIPARSNVSENVNFRVTGNPGAMGSRTSIATAKNWNIDIQGDGTGCKD